MSVLSWKNMTRPSVDVLNAQRGYEQVFTTTTLALRIKTLREKHRPETTRCTGTKLRHSLSNRQSSRGKNPPQTRKQAPTNQQATWQDLFDYAAPFVGGHHLTKPRPHRSPPFPGVLCHSPPFSAVLRSSLPFSDWNMGFCLLL